MSREEAMSLIEGREYANPGFRHGWAKRTSRLMKRACDVALLKRGKVRTLSLRRANDWIWLGIGGEVK